MARLSDRVAIVTGGARGIGFATAQRFAAEGATLAIVDLDEANAIDAAGRLGEERPHLGIGADVGDAESAKAAVERTVSELGRVDILMNNAGITRDNLLHKMTDEDWGAVISVHLTGAFQMSRAAQVHFVSQRSGRILNVSSTSALGNRGQANYSAAKMGIQGLTRTLALELGKFGITVNAVAPGFVVSDMTAATAERLHMSFEDFQAAVASQNAVGRVGRPEDIAAAAAFLVSDEASYITGQTLYVDGGQTLG
jgi:3-oxoacyl-[acyl-carrier protein] reductase